MKDPMINDIPDLEIASLLSGEVSDMAQHYLDDVCKELRKSHYGTFEKPFKVVIEFKIEQSYQKIDISPEVSLKRPPKSGDKYEIDTVSISYDQPRLPFPVATLPGGEQGATPEQIKAIADRKDEADAVKEHVDSLGREPITTTITIGPDAINTLKGASKLLRGGKL